MTDEELRAERVRDYWQRRGYQITLVTKYVTDGGHISFSMRSNLVNGLPRNLRPEVPVDVARKINRE